MRKGYTENDIDNINIDVKKTKSKKYIIKLLICTIICAFVYYQLYILVEYTLGKREKESMWLYNGMNKIMSIIIPEAKQTTEENSLKLLALGDIYASTNILKGAKSAADYNFLSSFEQTKEVLLKYDVVLASLNTPVGGSSLGYSTKTIYNAPNELLKTIKQLNISVLASAGNHMMDKGAAAVKTTISQIGTNGINQIGLNSSEERAKPYIIDKNNIKVAILSYMTASNVKITTANEYLINVLSEENIKADMTYIKTQNVDYVICYLNASNEDSTRVNAEQKNSVEMLFENGVNIVLGTGSKVVQEKVEDSYELSDGTNNPVYAIYSLGDFLGDMDTDDRKISVAADITFTKSITKDKDGNIIEEKTKDNMKINTPLSFYTKVSTTYKTVNYPINITLDSYNQDKITLDAKDYKSMKAAQESLKEIFK